MNAEIMFRAIGEISVDKIMEADTNTIHPWIEKKQLGWRKATKPKVKKRILSTFTAAAAVLIFALLVHTILPSQIQNSFTLRVYAMELQEDGSMIWREADLTNQIGWSGYHDGENFFKSIVFMPTGENIQSVELRTDVGFFAKQYRPETFEPNTPMSVDDGNILMFGTDFEIIGNTLTLTNGETMDSYLLFWGQEDAELDFLLHKSIQNLTLHAYVTFYDGETQTEAITIRFGDMSGMISISEGVLDVPSWPDLDAINLDDLTFIPESVQTLVPYDDIHNQWHGFQMYIWERDGGLTFIPRYSLDVYGEFRVGLSRVGRSDVVVLAVVRLNDNGDVVGMEYIVPTEIAEKFGF